jgi:phosphoglycerate kinase
MSEYADIVSTAKTVIWAGPMGKYEEEKYITGTHLLAEEVIGSGAYTVVGGGDIIAALNNLELLDLFGFVSVGGGAMLDFLEKGTLPALEVLH